MPTGRTAILVTSPPGQPTLAELARQAATGERPRKDYVELAGRLDADVVDSHWMQTRAHPLARMIAERRGMAAGQVAEGFLRGRGYAHVLAWADRIGLPLALLNKLARRRSDLVLVSVWLSRGKKAVFLRRLRADSALRAIVTRSEQAEIARRDLGVPTEKLWVEPRPVDDRFWCPSSGPRREMICAAGWEARDYGTLLRAVRDLDVELELAVGSIALPEMEGAGGLVDSAVRRLVGASADRVTIAERRPAELRELYAAARFVVVPVHDMEFDAGVTAVTEAMAMGRAVIASRTRGIGDLFRDGEQGLLVPPGDARALREATTHLLAYPEEAERMGRAARALVERRHRMDPCLDRLASIVQGDAEPAPGGLEAAAPA